MCHDSKSFTTFYQLQEAINIMLGDGRMLTAVRRGERKQICAAFSTAGVEYVALAGATQEATWTREDLHHKQTQPSYMKTISELFP